MSLLQDILDRPLATGSSPTMHAWEESLALDAIHASRTAHHRAPTARGQAEAAVRHAASAMLELYQQEANDMLEATQATADALDVDTDASADRIDDLVGVFTRVSTAAEEEPPEQMRIEPLASRAWDININNATAAATDVDFEGQAQQQVMHNNNGMLQDRTDRETDTGALQRWRSSC